MARYINKDEFIAQIQDNFCTECNNYDGVKCKSCGIDDTIEMVENADEADVVPKSEVEEMKKDRYQILPDGKIELIPRSDVEALKKEVAREIFKDILNIIRNYSYDAMCCGNNYGITQAEYIGIDILELKKKYTEDNNDG